MRTRFRFSAAATALVLLLGACGDDDDGGTDAVADVTEDAGDDATESERAGDEAATPAGEGGGTATLGDETIDLDQVLCYLKEQERAGLGGTIEFSIQASGANSAGENVIVDISRVHPDPDGGLTGETDSEDHIKVDIGDPASDSAVSWTGGGDVGTVTIQDGTVSATGISMTQLSGPETSELGFDLTCTTVQE